MFAETAQTVRSVEQPNAELIFGNTPAMHEVRRKLDLALQDDLPVLIEGESGTGKEVTGRFLHWHSVRRVGPFVKVNCGALPSRLLESEMFGNESDQCGGGEEKNAIGMASSGTLFLDEIGDLDPVLQRRLIRNLQIGRSRSQDDLGRRDVARFVCASCMNLDSKARENPTFAELLGCFGHRVRLLPLRERKRDLPQLCEYLAEKFARNFGRPVPHLSESVLAAFGQWNWAGNIRELENWIARIVVFGTEDAMGPEYGRQRGGRIDAGSGRHRATLNWRARRYR